MEDGNSHTTSYAYSTAGYLSEITYPGSDTVQFTSYADSGHLLQREDGNSVITNYSYSDADGMLSAVAYPAFGSLNVSLSYDSYDRCTSSSDGAGSYSYGYDDRDVLTTNTTTTYTGLAGKTISYTFNNDGSRAGMSTPAGSFSYTYDGDGRLSSLTNPFSETSGWNYYNNGWLDTQTLGNGAVTTDSYNGLGELTDLLNQDNMSNTLSEFSSLVYNASGSRTSGTATLTGVSSLSGSLSYGYDSKDELTSDASSRNGSYSHSFGYDSAGNPTTWMGGSKTFNSDNQDTSNTFDGNGNPTTYSSTTLTFDPENGMTAFGFVLTAGYRFDGLRAWKHGSSTTYFLYDDDDTPIVELNSSGTVIATNTFGAAGLLSRRVSSTSTFYQFDAQGGTAQRLNSSCGVTQSTAFDAWGNPVGTAGSDPFQYDAQEGSYTDTETGLVLLTYRYYDPAAGRFLNRDPIRYDGGVNLFAYCENGPVTQSDPDGTDGTIFFPVTGGGLLGGGLGEGIGTILSGGGGTLTAILGGFGGPPGWVVGGAIVVVGVGTYIIYEHYYGQPCPAPAPACAAEHTKNPSPSKLPKHQKGQAAKQRDCYGGEKGDANRDPKPRPLPKGDPRKARRKGQKNGPHKSKYGPGAESDEVSTAEL